LGQKKEAVQCRVPRVFWEARGGDAGSVVHSDERGIAERAGCRSPQERTDNRFPKDTRNTALNRFFLIQ